MYFQLYPTQAVQGFLFGISQAQANAWIHRLTGVLNQALGYKRQLPERDPANLERVLSTCPSLEFLIDGTERRIIAPKTKPTAKPITVTVKNLVVPDRGAKCAISVIPMKGKNRHWIAKVGCLVEPLLCKNFG